MQGKISIKIYTLSNHESKPLVWQLMFNTFKNNLSHRYGCVINMFAKSHSTQQHIRSNVMITEQNITYCSQMKSVL